MFAWQVFDAKISPKLRDEYRIRQVTKVQANTIEELAEKLEGVDPKAFVKTVKAFNDSVMTDVPLNLAVKDGRGTKGLEIPKSNWSRPIDQGPFMAYPIIPGICFTYGGIKINKDSQVVDSDGRAIPGLYAAGEATGLYHQVYTGATSVMRGAVFGKIAGEHATSKR